MKEFEYIVNINYLAHTNDHLSTDISQYLYNRYQATREGMNGQHDLSLRITEEEYVSKGLANFIPPGDDNVLSENFRANQECLVKRLENIKESDKLKIIIVGHGMAQNRDFIYRNNIHPTSYIAIAEYFYYLFKGAQTLPVFNDPGPSISLVICYAARSKDYLMNQWSEFNYRNPDPSEETSLAYKIAAAIKDVGFKYFTIDARLTPLTVLPIKGKDNILDTRIRSYSEEYSLIQLQMEYYISKNFPKAKTILEKLNQNEQLILELINIKISEKLPVIVNIPLTPTEFCSIIRNTIPRVDEFTKEEKALINKVSKDIIIYCVLRDRYVPRGGNDLQRLANNRVVYNCKNGIVKVAQTSSEDDV